MEYASSRARFTGTGQTGEYSKQAPTPYGVGTCGRAPQRISVSLQGGFAHSVRRQAPQASRGATSDGGGSERRLWL